MRRSYLCKPIGRVGLVGRAAANYRTRASGMPRLLAMLCSYPHMPGTPDNTFTSHGAGDLPSLG
eukprot:scaffold6813_cov65-Phaeocystis_antarctica.AAC.1